VTYDADAVRRAVRDLLAAVGEDPDREGLRDTPERMARAYAEMFSGLDEDPGAHVERAFDVGHSEMVLVRDIPLYSVCEHHLLPFHGAAHVAYIPGEDGRVTGLSKVARLVDGEPVGIRAAVARLAAPTTDGRASQSRRSVSLARGRVP